MADRGLKGVYQKVFECAHQLLLNKFFDLSTSLMRKLDNGGETGGINETGH